MSVSIGYKVGEIYRTQTILGNLVPQAIHIQQYKPPDSKRVNITVQPKYPYNSIV